MRAMLKSKYLVLKKPPSGGKYMAIKEKSSKTGYVKIRCFLLPRSVAC